MGNTIQVFLSYIFLIRKGEEEKRNVYCVIIHSFWPARRWTRIKRVENIQKGVAPFENSKRCWWENLNDTQEKGDWAAIQNRICDGGARIQLETRAV
jgi:hypothetical protein